MARASRIASSGPRLDEPMDPSVRHASFRLVPEEKAAFYRKRFAQQVEEELQRVRTTIAWARHEGWPELLFARILSTYEIEDILVVEEAARHPIEIIAIESGKGLFVKRPGHPVKRYAQTFAQMKKRLVRKKG